MSEPLPSTAGRLLSLDAYRGLVMLAMASDGLGLRRVAQQFPESPVWQAVRHQLDHVPWVGCAAWDLIQPSFMFLVGVSLAFSCASRAAKGHSFGQMAWHAGVRSLVLVLLGIFLRSRNAAQTNFTFEDVLTQIGLGYFFLFLLWNRPRAVQWAAAAAILVGYWALFRFWPLPGAGFNYAAVDIRADWPHLTGAAAHWDKNANPAAYFDQWFLNLFPRPKPFVYNGGGYETLSFIPSLATMIFGLLAGELLRSSRPAGRKVQWLVAAGLVGLAAGWALDAAGICPLVKRIWTPTWTIYSTGWTCLLLGAFYGLVDGLGYRRWAFPLIVVGTNSILMYTMAELLPPWVQHTLGVHFGAGIFDALGPAWRPFIEHSLTLLAMWLICLWLYRQRVFIRI